MDVVIEVVRGAAAAVAVTQGVLLVSAFSLRALFQRI
jgi:hypothetical protein